MKAHKLQIRLTLLSFLSLFLCLNVRASDRVYLSGKDVTDATLWDFKMSTGRNSGYWTKIPVPSHWELHGFGHYTYGKDHEHHEKDPEIGYYKRTFSLRNISGKRCRLTFEGAMTDTRVKVNGVSIGEVHQGGFTRFNYEITDQVREGSNTIEVEVTKSSSHTSIQRSERNADFWLFGGIYRPVYIDILPMEFIERVSIDAGMKGKFNMNVYLNGTANATQVEVRVLSSKGVAIGKPVKVSLGREDTLVSIRSRFSDIEPWSHEFPTLYKVVITLKAKNEILHAYTRKFGFRTFEVRDHDGFYLNGKRILLKGANMHSFRPATGRALSRRDVEENFKLLKELHFNCVRPCHYPPDPYFFDLCDSLGMLAMDELPGWHAPLQTGIGAKLVKELVVRDVNHPSIILWGNGNHRSHNPELDKHFFQWDIQKRRPLKNASRKEDIFARYNPPFDIVDTRFYPSYSELTERLNGKHIVLPNECLHALYDGGGAASLKDYWSAFRASKVGGGLMIWALYDECVVRTDQGYRLDCQQNKAPDGIVGPHGEKEGSYYAVREIWSPVQVAMKVLPEHFDGVIHAVNDFTFVNLNQCTFEASLLHFSSPNEAKAGYRTHPIETRVADIPAGEEGKINLALPENWKTYDALQLKARDHRGNEIYTWCWTIGERKRLISGFVGPSKVAIKQDPDDPFVVKVGATEFTFNSETGVLEKVVTAGKQFPVGATPFLVYEAKDNSTPSNPTSTGKVTVQKKDNTVVIESSNINGFDRFSWTVMPQGYLTLDYAFTLPKGEYDYAGVGLQLQKESILGKRWLGEGPARIWKNRQEGGTLNVWERQKELNIPGEVYNPPAFEGYFAPWYWSVFTLSSYHHLGLSAVTDGLALGVSVPVNGKEPKSATWHYPEQAGIYVFNYISPVGAKWRDAVAFGPSGQPNSIRETCQGTIRLYFDWNRADQDMQKFKEEIE